MFSVPGQKHKTSDTRPLYMLVYLPVFTNSTIPYRLGHCGIVFTTDSAEASCKGLWAPLNWVFYSAVVEWSISGV